MDTDERRASGDADTDEDPADDYQDPADEAAGTEQGQTGPPNPPSSEDD